MYNLYNDVFHNPQFKKVQVGDLLFAEYTCEPGDLRSRLWSENAYFTFVLNGKIELITLHGRYLLEAGKAFFVQKGSCIFQLFKEEEYCELIMFVTDEMIRSVIEKHQIPFPPSKQGDPVDMVVPLKMDSILTSYRQSLLTHFRHNQSLSKPLLKVKFEELLLNVLVIHPHKKLQRSLQAIGASGKLSLSYVMEQNYCSDLSMSEFAQLCARSLSSFRRDFRQHYGMPPAKWLKEKRLERSKYLLAYTDMTLEAICFECGFNHRSHFSRLFKQQFGQSPAAFRKDAAVKS